MKWREPLELKWDYGINDYKADSAKFAYIPDKPGIYIFARRHGAKHSPIYVGYSATLRSRITQQLNNHRLMIAVQHAGNGKRLILTAQPITKPGQNAGKIAKAMEAFLIRKLHAEGCDLLNDKGTKRIVKTVKWSGSTAARDIVPLYVKLS